MAEAEKKLVKNEFDGGLDYDSQVEDTAAHDYLYALNIRQASTGAGDVGEIVNVLGNQLISYSLPAGTNKCIGTKSDEAGNRIFYFVYNSNGYHSILQYNVIAGYIEKVLQSITDNGGAGAVDLLNFDPGFLILNAELVDNNLLYFVDQGRNPARKINISKIKDKSITGYNAIEDYIINAFKRAPSPPKNLWAIYADDKSRQNNKLYRHLFKFAYQYVYDDAEQSTWSDFSTVPLPANEPYNSSSQQSTTTPNYTINQTNNVIIVTVNTGYNNVSQINIAAQIDGLNWVLVGNINKATQKIADAVDYDFRFYNDGSYSALDPNLLIQPFSFLPQNPVVQTLLNNRAMCYSGYYEGFDPFTISVKAALGSYTPALSGQTVSVTSTPVITMGASQQILPSGQNGTLITGKPITINFTNNPLVAGMVFGLYDYAWNGGKNAYATYIVTATDTYQTIGLYFSKLFRRNPAPLVAKVNDQNALITILGGDPSSFVNYNSGTGVLTFTVYRSSNRFNPPNLFMTVNPGVYQAISLTNKTYKVNKTGSRVQYGIIYEDSEGRKTQVFTDPAWNIYSPTVTENFNTGFTQHGLNILNQPPAYAVKYQIVRTRNLTHASLLQFYTQAINIVQNNTRNDYLDLVIQGLNTYKKTYPQSILGYTFTPGDRCRFLLYVPSAAPTTQIYFYNTNNANNNFNEVEIVEQRFNTIYPVNTTVTLNGNASSLITVIQSDISKVGMLVTITGVNNQQYQRRILGAPDSTHYTIDATIADTGTYNSYSFQDDRMVLRVKNPNFPNFGEPNTLGLPSVALIEIFTPSTESGLAGSLVYFEFGMKFNILNPGLPNAAHEGQNQNQDGLNPATTPATFVIKEGDTYARLREMPITNVYPSTASYISVIEDYNFSDFYPSTVNDNGRPEAEAPYSKRSLFTQTVRNSQNYVPGTNINGLSLFMNTDRKDYTDTYGPIRRLFYKDQRLYFFKHLRTGFCMVGKVSANLADGQQQVFYTNALLQNVIDYYAWRGGIGGNPESFAENGTNIYFVSPNSGVALRLGGDGLIPISTLYKMDSYFKPKLRDYDKFGGRIYGAFDRKNTEYVVAFENTNSVFYNDVFSSSAWQTQNTFNINPATFSIVTGPTNGTLGSIDASGNVTYTPTAGYSGPDSFTYNVQQVGGGVLSTVKQCINVIAPNRLTAWRGTSPSCGSGATQGFVTYATLTQYYVDTITGGDPQTATPTGVTKANTQTISSVLNPDYIAPFYNITLCPNLVTPTMNVTYDVYESGATITLSGSTYTVPAGNASGSGSQVIGGVGIGTAYTISVVVPQASTASVTINGSTQSVTPATSGNQTLSFSYTGSASAIAVTITGQAQVYRGRQSDSYCEKGTATGGTVTGLMNPYDIVVVNSANKAFITNTFGACVYVVDTNPANVATYNTIIATIGSGTLSNPRNIIYVASTGLVYFTDQSIGKVYTINPSTYALTVLATIAQAWGIYYSTFQSCILVAASSGGIGKVYAINATTGATIGTGSCPGTNCTATFVNEDATTGNIYTSESNGFSQITRVYVFSSAMAYSTTITMPVSNTDTSYNMCFAPTQRQLYVPCSQAQKVFVIDTNPANTGTYNTIIATITLLNNSGTARYLSINSKVYICSNAGATIYQISPASNTIDFTVIAGSAPIAMDYASGPPGLYFANRLAGTATEVPYPASFVNNHYQGFQTAEQVFSGSGVLTGVNQPNVVGGANYIAHVLNNGMCP